MKNRLEIVWQLLRDDGVIFVQCDDNEQAYLKVLMDEIFGRDNFIVTFVRKISSSPRLDAKHVSSNIDYVLLYGKLEPHLKLNMENVSLEDYRLEDEFEKTRGKYKRNKLDRGSIHIQGKWTTP